MANYFEAVKKVLEDEGGYALIAGDKGGETYKGIARNYHSNWEGWTAIDQYKKALGGKIKTGTIFKDERLNNLILSFYKVNFWNKIYGDSIANQDLANLLFSMYVNAPGSAIKYLQQILKVAVDSSFGPSTLKALNLADPVSVYNSLKQAMKAHYAKRAKTDPSQAKFLEGWLNRLAKYPDLKKKDLA